MLEFQGNQYVVVHDWSEDEKLCYRELKHDRIEMLSIFCGDAQTAQFNAGFMKMILDHREKRGEVSAETD